MAVLQRVSGKGDCTLGVHSGALNLACEPGRAEAPASVVHGLHGVLKDLRKGQQGWSTEDKDTPGRMPAGDGWRSHGKTPGVFCLFAYFLIYLFIFYLWLRWVSVAARGFSLAAVSRGYSSCGAWASHCGGFSCCGARALGAQTSVVVARRLSSCGSRALERRLSSCGARA